MDNALKLILQKLEGIEKVLAKSNVTTTEAVVRKPEKDPLFEKAVKIVAENTDDLSSISLGQKLGIDSSRAEKLLLQMADLGLGECYNE